MTLSEARREFLQDYWRALLARHNTAAEIAEDAGVSVSYVYTALATHSLPTPHRRK